MTCRDEKLPIVKVLRVSDLKGKLQIPTAGEVERFGKKSAESVLPKPLESSGKQVEDDGMGSA